MLEFPLYLVLVFEGVKYGGVTGAAIAWVIRVAIDAVLLLYLAYRSLPPRRKELADILALAGGSLPLLIGAMYLPTLQVKILFLALSFAIIGLLVWFKFTSPQEKIWVGKCLTFFSDSSLK